MFECELCLKRFAKRSSLVQHRRRMHVSKIRFQCFQCDYAVRQKCDLVKHIRRQHLKEPSASDRAIRQYCCVLCDSYAGKDRKSVVEHYIEQHGVVVQEQKFSFASMTEFEEWRRNVEVNDVCQFVHSQGPKNRSGYRVQYFRCFRNGYFRSQSKGVRRSKIKGSNKIDGVCPASIKAVEDRTTGKVDATFTPDHIGHCQELGRLNLTREEKAEIVAKLSEQIPQQSVVDQIVRTAGGPAKDNTVRRIHLTTRKDVWNILRSYKKSREIPSNDCGCAEIEVTPEGESDLVRFYNSQSFATQEHADNGIDEKKTMIRSKVEEILERFSTHEDLDLVWNALTPIVPTISGIDGSETALSFSEANLTV